MSSISCGKDDRARKGRGGTLFLTALMALVELCKTFGGNRDGHVTRTLVEWLI